MKTVFNLNQFVHQNEPRIAATIGNIAMILGIIASIPTIFATAGVAVPAVIVSISAKATAGLLITKAITKMFGTVDENGTPVTTILSSTKEQPK